MEGISKERLVDLAKEIRRRDSNDNYLPILYELIEQCTELNQWIPIDENTPKDRRIMLFYPERSEGLPFPMKAMTIAGEWNNEVIKGWRCDLYLLWMQRKSKAVQPTHWQELPKDFI